MSAFRNLLSSPLAMLKLAISLCYMALGIYLLINIQLLSFIDPTYRKVLPWVFIIYGAYRLLRAVTDLRNE